MRAFIKTFESYIKTAFISMAWATCVFMIAAAIHKLSISAIGVSGTGVGVFSFILAVLVFIVVLSIVIELLSIEALVSYLGSSAFTVIEYNRKFMKEERRELRPFKKSRKPKGFGLVSVELLVLRIVSGIILFIFLVRLMFSSLIATFIEGDRKNRY
jgi:hypothetical protein